MKLYPKPQVCEIMGSKIELNYIGLVCNEPFAARTGIYKELLVKSLNGNKTIEIFKKDITDFPESYIKEKNKNKSNEAYGIIITEDKIDIYCSDDRTFYYGMLDIYKLLECNELYEGFIYNYPNMQVRGIIEGFYGIPWSLDDRIDSIKTISRHKMNTYIYAPKDDSYHRDKWYEPYPLKEFDNIKKLYDSCREYFIDFVYSISPGMSVKYSDENDFNRLKAKYMQIYDLGVRDYAIMLDDIPVKLMNRNDIIRFNELADAHIYIVNRLYEYFKKLDFNTRLIVCPTSYFGRGNESYIAKLGRGIPEDVDIFWTGRAICSQELDTRDAKYFYENTGHKPLYWDNYPVNDAGMINEMHLGPIINRDRDLYTFSKGLVSNLMEYKESSMIPVITAAHYLWNSIDYDSKTSLGIAAVEVAGNRDSENLLYFIKYCSKSCINITTCEEFLEEMAACQYLLMNGSPIKAIFKMQRFFSRGLGIGCALLNMENKKLLNEIKPWIDKYIDFNRICLDTIKCRKMKAISKKRYLLMKRRTLEKYNSFKANPIEMMDVEANMIINSMLDD